MIISNRLLAACLGLLVVSSVFARSDYDGLIHAASVRHSVPEDLIRAVIQAESGFNPKARSPKNAQGLMQLIPKTAARFGVKDAWDPKQNIDGGTAYLAWLLKHFDGDYRLTLAGYNAGEKAVERYQGVPPYPETQKYIRRVLGYLKTNATRPITATAVASTTKPSVVRVRNLTRDNRVVSPTQFDINAFLEGGR